MKLGDKLRKLRNEKSIKQKELGEFLQLSQKAISNYERNIRQPDNETLKKIANFFSVSTDFLLGTCEVKDRNNNTYKLSDKFNLDSCSFSINDIIQIPVVGEIRAGSPILAQENIIDYVYLPSNLSRENDYFGLRVIGDSMNLSQIMEGNFVIVKKQDTVENGEIAVVLIDGEKATIKKFYKNDNVITLIPNSSNPVHQPRMIDMTNVEVKILGKVVQSIIRF